MYYLHCGPVVVSTRLCKNGKNYRILKKFEIGPKLFIIYILIYILFLEILIGRKELEVF